MHNMHMKVIVRRLIVHVQLNLIPLHAGIQPRRRVQYAPPHAPQPGRVRRGQVAHGPKVAPLDHGEKVQRRQRGAVPVEVGQQQEALVVVNAAYSGCAAVLPQDHVLLLCAPVQDVVHPRERTGRSLRRHERPDVRAVDGRRLVDDACHLRGVLGNVGGRARVNEVELEVRRDNNGAGGRRSACLEGGLRGCGHGSGRGARREEPAVDVVGAEVADVGERAGEGDEGEFARAKGGALGEQDRGLVVDGAEEGQAAAGLVCCLC